MDGRFYDGQRANESVAGLIRAIHSGMCSGEPQGIRYPGVPSVDEVLGEMSISPDTPMTEELWDVACDIISDRPLV